MDEKLTSGEAYTFTLLEEWKNLIILGREFRMNYLEGRCDPTTVNAYVGSLTNFYEILAPKVHAHNGEPGSGETSWNKLIARFDSWRGWVANPTWFQSSGSMDMIFQFRELLGDVVEKLDVTFFPKAAGRNL